MAQADGIPRRLPTVSGQRSLLGGPSADPRQEIERLRVQVENLYDALARRVNEMLLSDTLANRPDAGVKDRLFIATDQLAGANAFHDTGSAWVLL